MRYSLGAVFNKQPIQITLLLNALWPNSTFFFFFFYVLSGNRVARSLELVYLSCSVLSNSLACYNLVLIVLLLLHSKPYSRSCNLPACSTRNAQCGPHPITNNTKRAILQELAYAIESYVSLVDIRVYVYLQSTVREKSVGKVMGLIK